MTLLIPTPTPTPTSTPTPPTPTPTPTPMMYLLSRNGSTARYDESSGAYKDGKSTTESRIRERKREKKKGEISPYTFVHS